MAFFFSVNKEVIPLRANLARQEARLSAAMQELDKVQAVLAEKERGLDLVRAQYESAIKNKKRLNDAATVCRRKMAVASLLINGLRFATHGRGVSLTGVI